MYIDIESRQTQQAKPAPMLSPLRGKMGQRQVKQS